MSYPALQRWLSDRASLEPSLLEGAGFDGLVAERMGVLRARDEHGYLALLERSDDELELLVGQVAVAETYFFRYPESFQLLEECLGRRLHDGAARLRMLSIGCAGGEEPYGMAMTALHAGWAQEAVEVVGIDRNPRVLERARRGEYGGSSIRGVMPEWAARWMPRKGNMVDVDPGVRAMVRFERADATSSEGLPCGSRFDVVLCRNLLIYLNASARERLMGEICQRLVVGGLLLVGHTEKLLFGRQPVRHLPTPHAFALERVEQGGANDRTLGAEPLRVGQGWAR